MSPPTSHPGLLAWVNEVADLAKPEKVVWYVLSPACQNGIKYILSDFSHVGEIFKEDERIFLL